jgi:hypothetical protein
MYRSKSNISKPKLKILLYIDGEITFLLHQRTYSCMGEDEALEHWKYKELEIFLKIKDSFHNDLFFWPFVIIISLCNGLPGGKGSYLKLRFKKSLRSLLHFSVARRWQRERSKETSQSALVCSLMSRNRFHAANYCSMMNNFASAVKGRGVN